MPTFLKVVIAIGVMGFVATFILLALGIMFVKDNLSPEHAAKVASQVVLLPDPLPPGWHYGVGLDVGYQKVVNVQFRGAGGANALVQFSKLPNPAKISGEDMATRMFAGGNNAGVKFESEARGVDKIGGQPAHWVRTHFSMLGRTAAMEVAFVDLPDGNVVQIQSTEQGRNRFDATLVKPLLNSVKGFESEPK